MTSLNVDRKVKEEFDELKPDGYTQSEFIEELLAAYRRDNGEIVDVGAVVEQITKQTASEVELAAYRGVAQALEDKS
jgi:hypothetical protein